MRSSGTQSLKNHFIVERFFIEEKFLKGEHFSEVKTFFIGPFSMPMDAARWDWNKGEEEKDGKRGKREKKRTSIVSS